MRATMHVTHDESGEIVYLAFQEAYEGPVQTHPLRENLNVDMAPDGRIVGMQVLGVSTLNVETLGADPVEEGHP